MKKVYLIPVSQHDTTFYIGKYDPRKLVKMTDPTIDVNTLQEAQRPLDNRHLLEIADYASHDKQGVLPASILIATKETNKLIVKSEVVSGETKYYIEFPESETELDSYSNTIDVIDGQHRLFAFDVKYRDPDFKDSINYEIPFSIFITPTLFVRRKLFTITNEKQKAVSPNLLLYLKSMLGMLNNDEETYLPLVQALNEENMSPLKGRIIISAEKISKGYKAKELIKIFSKAKLADIIISGNPISKENLVKALSIYIQGWESHYQLSFKSPGTETMTKISGLRYIMLLFETFFDHSINTRKPFDVNFVKTVIQDLENAKQLDENQTLFDDSMLFRGEGATVKLANDDANRLKAYLANKATDNFNPLA
ncbi:MAG: DGQHR domain-containing protein [Clostridia bacterium]|nr:DGQHR domain-containing protein [Clostridia bacterium]